MVLEKPFILLLARGAGFHSQIRKNFQTGSACSWEQGWNVKFKKAGKTLCTLYPRELFFTVMVVVGKREPFFKQIIAVSTCTPRPASLSREAALARRAPPEAPKSPPEG